MPSVCVCQSVLRGLLTLGGCAVVHAAGQASNGVQTMPGKGWNTILRLYGPLQAWFDKTWRPSEIELVK